MSRDLLSDSAEQLFRQHCTMKHVTAIEEGGSAAALWRQLLESGFADALVPEAQGGAGLGLRGAFPLLLACGAHAVPLPLAQTMVARAALAIAGREVPDGPIALCSAAPGLPDGAITCLRVPYGRVSEWALVALGGSCALLPTAQARVTPTGVHASLEADLHWPSLPAGAAPFARSYEPLPTAACLLAAQLAGAMDRVLKLTIDHANERSQFGRSIGKFQAIQQQISVLAEHAFAARMAAQLGCESASHAPDPLLAAVAKSRTSEAAAVVAAVAHAVHGAMGITAELELQLHTRRLHEWRSACGAESCWNARIGEALAGAAGVSTLELVRGRLGASEPRAD